MKTFDWISLILLIIGGLNWMLVGIFNYDLVAAMFGAMSVLTRIIYILVGLSALYALAFFTLKFKRAPVSEIHRV